MECFETLNNNRKLFKTENKNIDEENLKFDMRNQRSPIIYHIKIKSTIFLTAFLCLYNQLLKIAME